MKTTRNVRLAIAAGGSMILGLTAGCADQEPPPPPGVAVVGFVPDYCFWDGYEYVGWDEYAYYYWTPNRVWLRCDPVRVRHANAWINAHPNWRPPPNSTTTQPAANSKVHPLPPPAPTAPPVVKHYRRHDPDHDHD
jgi:hypothetical protein